MANSTFRTLTANNVDGLNTRRNYIPNGDATNNTSGWATYAETDSVTFQDTGDTVTLNSHGLQNGQTVAFTSITSTTGISTNTLYYVVSATTNTFQVATSSGGSALALTTNGSGTLVRFLPKTGASGGSPTITWTSSSSSPLSLDNSFVFTKDANNRMGQGASYDFTIDSTDQAKVLQIEMDYIVGSGTFVAGSSSTNSDLLVWIYDVTNAVLIQPTTYKFLSNSSTISDKFVANFQTASNSTSYRLIIQCASVSASAYTVKFDRIRVCCSQYVYGTPVTDWTSFTPTITHSSGGMTNATTTGYWRRVGDSIEMRGNTLFGGTSAAFSEYRIALPSGLSTDTNKITSTSSFVLPFGYGHVYDSGSRVQASGNIFYRTTTTFELRYPSTESGTNPVNVSQNSITNTAPVNSLGLNDTIGWFITAPISGWSSSVQTSDQADSRVVAASYTGTGDTSVAANSTEVIPYLTRVIDTHAAYNTATGEYTVPISGVYLINAKVKGTISTTSQDQILILRRNGSNITLTSAAAQTAISGFSFQPVISHTISLNAGDIITVLFQNAWSGGATTIANDSYTTFNIQRLSQASLISATETVAASYTGAGDTSIAANSTETLLYNTKVLDTHGSYNTSTGEFTTPVAGIYTIYGKTVVTVATTNVSQRFLIYVNGAEVIRAQYDGSTATSGVSFTASALHTLRLSAGDIVTIRYSNGWAGGVASLSAQGSSMSITRIGI